MKSPSIHGTLRPIVRFLARFGCFSIGTVYVLIGVWALLALLRLADPAADEERILQRMTGFPLGGAFIAAIALGTAGYILWLLYEAILDPYGLGKSVKGLAERIGTALSALAYAVIVSASLKVLSGQGGHGEEGLRVFTGKILDWTGGQWLVGAAGLLVIFSGFFQIKFVYDRDHERRVRMDRLKGFLREGAKVMAWGGYLARCAILLVLGWFLLDAAISADPRAVGDTDTAFDFLGLGGNLTGDSLFTLAALGTIFYGIFMYINGAYFKFEGK
jgi:hypothetical protein